MKQYLLLAPIYPLVSLFIITSFLLARKALCIDPQFLACNPETCGDDLSITFPFYIEAKQDKFCGYPGFNISCHNRHSILQLQGIHYTIHQISYEKQTLRVSNTEVFNTANTCIPPFQNISYNDKFQLYQNQTEIVFLYNCNSSQIGGLMDYKVNCSSDNASKSTLSMFKDDPLLESASSVCENSVVGALDFEGGESSTEIQLMEERGFVLSWTASNCSVCHFSGGKCGFDLENFYFKCFCPDRPRAKNCVPGDMPLPIKVIIGGLSSAFAALIIISGCYYCFRTKRGIWSDHKAMKHGENNVEAFITSYHSLMPQRYSYLDIKKMTNSFTHKLGQGGFGGVYRGNLSDGRLVAVKLLEKSIGDGEEFINEVASISRTSHVNVVTLLGFCYQNTKRALVYEYMPNGSLDKFIYHLGDEKICHLEQKQLFEIAIGIARGLEYLHRGCNTRIVHFDIKPHNILLDNDMCPKISDFGLAKLCKGKESIVSMMGARGTVGYIAPEVFMRGYGGVSYKSDVYSYGMMILEMFAGKDIVDNEGTETSSSVYFPDAIYKYLERGEIDENMSSDEGEIVKRRMIKVGLWCIQTNPTDRPSMTKVIEMLEGSIEFLHVPPKPLLSSSSNHAEFSSSSSSTYLQSKLDEEKVMPLPEAEFVSH